MSLFCFSNFKTGLGYTTLDLNAYTILCITSEFSSNCDYCYKRIFASHSLNQGGVLLYIRIQSGDWHGWCLVDIM